MKINIELFETPTWAKVIILAGALAALTLRGHSAETTRNKREAKAVAVSAPAKKVDPGTAKKTPPGNPLVSEVGEFEKVLRDAAERGQAIVAKMPNAGVGLADNFREMREVLVDAKNSVTALLERREAIEKKGEEVLNATAGAREVFVRLVKEMDAEISEWQKDGADNPKAFQSRVQSLQGVKEAAANAEKMLIPLRDLILATQKDATSVFSELAAYPRIFDFAIRTCDAYGNSLGDGVEFAAIINSLASARDNLRECIYFFTQAAQKAEEALKNVPSIPASAVRLPAGIEPINTSNEKLY